jgi:hypothetical protein
MLAKFIAISLRWPLFLNHLAERRDLINQIEKATSDTSRPIAAYWRSKSRFMELFNFRAGQNGVKAEGWDKFNLGDLTQSFDMKLLDVDRLLRISPLVRRAPIPTTNPSVTPASAPSPQPTPS